MTSAREVISDWLNNQADPDIVDAMGMDGGEAIVAALDAAGFVIVSKEPTTKMLFGTKTEWPDVSLGQIWEEMIEAAQQEPQP